MRSSKLSAIGSTLLLLTQAIASDSPSGLVVDWTFDEGQGDVLEDRSGNSHTGDINGNVVWAKGAFGTALHFGGKDGYATTPAITGIDGSNELTVEAWVLWEGGSRYPNILTGGQWCPGGFLIFVADKTCSFRMGRPGEGPWQEASAPLVSNFETGKWYHLAATFKRPEITTYVNGRKVGSAHWDYPVAYHGSLEIGRWGGQSCHQGLIDEVKLFHRALSAQEIEKSFATEASRRVGPGQAAYTLLPTTSEPVAILENQLAKLEIDRRGRCTSLTEKRSGKNLLATVAPLATIDQAGQIIRPSACSWAAGQLRLTFGRDRAKATIGCTAKDRYFRFSVIDVQGEGVESLSFVTLPVQPESLSSSTSGAAIDKDCGICLRELNLQTEVRHLGGVPPSLRASCRSDYGLAGAEAGLVVAPIDQLRPVLQEMIQAEGLPQSSLGGPWALDAEEIRGSYLFGHPGERDVERWIDLAKRGGFTHLHHEGFYKTLGHYEPSQSLFPSGLEGLKGMVRKIHDAGLKAGMHTLTGCIDTRDSWVTPVPDKRLAADASYTLASDLDEKSGTILTVEKPQPHDVIWSYSGRGNAIRIGDEIIQYSAISSSPPYGFLNCTRGAFKTVPGVHRKSDRVDHLRQIYLAFYPDERSTLVDEVAGAIARVFNECEFDQIYMDGSEGMGGEHAIETMRNAIYKRLRRPAVVEASAWDHWSWYYHSRIGAWDHPKWGLKPFTDLHCAAISNYRQGALLQAQLGWWVVLGASSASHAETPDEMEYFCAKALAFDAPSSTQGIGSLSSPSNARVQEYLTLAGWYERLRLANYFSEEVRTQLQQPGKDFHLARTAEGQWQMLPTEYLAHKVTSLNNDSSAWKVVNPFKTQPVQLRVEALASVMPYDSPDSVPIAGPGDASRFTVRRAATSVVHKLEKSSEQVRDGSSSLRFTATSKRPARKGAWAQAGLRFEPPYFSIHPCDALGVWIFGDGKGEVLNLQLTSPREYMVAYGEHYIHIDFKGWRYFEIPLRERDAASYHKFEWPYFSLSGIYMTAVNRDHIDGLNLYLNHLPPNDTATVYLGPVKALRTARPRLVNPTLSINGQKLALPTTLAAGDYVELAGMDDCRVYNERGVLLERLALMSGPSPRLKEGENHLSFSCDPPAEVNARVQITSIAYGPPLTGQNPREKINWKLLSDEYDSPRVITNLKGKENSWETSCRKGEKSVPFRFEMEVEEVKVTDAAYQHRDALTLESFDGPEFFAEKGIDSAKPGVTQLLERSTEPVKIGKSCARYTATSKLEDNSGWSVRGKRSSKPLDLSKAQGIGFWLFGDGKGEAFKLQLRDTVGGWCDMVAVVDYTGWRYQQFDVARPGNLDRSKIQDWLIYYNSIPPKQTVTCWVDDIRALPAIPGLRDPELRIGENTLIFPVELWTGDRLVYEEHACRIDRKSGSAPERIQPRGTPFTLQESRNAVSLQFARDLLPEFRVAASLVKHYPKKDNKEDRKTRKSL